MLEKVRLVRTGMHSGQAYSRPSLRNHGTTSQAASSTERPDTVVGAQAFSEGTRICDTESRRRCEGLV
jgi:hypothetical protein